jgi:hypothetical protein
MRSSMLAGALTAVTLACGLGVAAAPGASATTVECVSTQTRLIGSAPNTVITYLGKQYVVSVGLYGKYDATVTSAFCGALKIIMRVTVPSGGVVTKGHVNLQTNAGDVNTTPRNDVAGTTTSFDSGWVAGHCMVSGFGLWVKPGTSTDSRFYTGWGSGSVCVS